MSDVEVEVLEEIVKRDTIPKILEWVGEDLGRASLVIEAESRKRIPRKKLIEALDLIVARGRVDEVGDMEEAEVVPPPLSDAGSSVPEAAEPEAEEVNPSQEEGAGEPVFLVVRVGGPRGRLFYVCPECGYKLISEAAARDHMEKKH